MQCGGFSWHLPELVTGGAARFETRMGTAQTKPVGQTAAFLTHP